jgi:hypothetical protein
MAVKPIVALHRLSATLRGDIFKRFAVSAQSKSFTALVLYKLLITAAYRYKPSIPTNH